MFFTQNRQCVTRDHRPRSVYVVKLCVCIDFFLLKLLLVGEMF